MQLIAETSDVLLGILNDSKPVVENNVIVYTASYEIKNNAVTKYCYKQEWDSTNRIGRLYLNVDIKKFPSFLFNNNKALHTIIIPNSIEAINSRAFEYCSNLTSVIIGDSIKSIGTYAFYGCSGLTSITIGNSVTSIENQAFYNCSSLTSITIPNSVTSISVGAFGNCVGLAAVYYTGNIAQWCGISFQNGNANPLYYAHNLYVNNELVTDLVILQNVTAIKNYTFNGATCLTSVTIGNSVESIGNYAFENCSNLASINILDSVTEIGNYAFRQTGWYNNQNNGILYLDNWCLGYKNDYPRELIINEDIKGIADEAFRSCSKLASLIIPNSVIHIGDYAFRSCSNLVSITIGSGVTNIGEFAFDYCRRLESIVIDSDNSTYDSRNDCNAIIETESNTLIQGCMNTEIPNSVIHIGDYAFEGCNGLTSVTIPNSVTSISNYAFNNCSNLTSVTCLALNPPSLGSNNFTASDDTLYVPSESVDLYKADANWSSAFGVDNILPIT